jgi:TP901 family phage tail tape measure protein
MTLFYQQGLDTNEAFEIGTETMKMARIAGLEYADATNLMTAALRGFNMELNETSAAKVNDVYSELAAITAADTEEIATAMTKTASIAANANMEFETTAALLSQIIETTREPAETAGTAMKTIIARFTEMKKATSDLISVDGEEVSVNKVEDALRSAGVALRDVNGEFRDLDDVFLELSSKWNGLDKMTQRYVATMAAGSRQQSRFIAMMSDYDRTMELVGAAYDSSGASQKQFEKTQDSLESKLNKLKNAWDEFLMGISNSKIIKAGVDALTRLLNVVNKFTGKSGLLKLGAAFGALKGGSAIFNKLFQSFAPLGKQMEKKGADIGTGLLKGLTQRLTNFTLGKGFVLDVDIGEKGFVGLSNKINTIKQDYAALMEAIKTPVIRDDAILMFEKIDDKIVATSMSANGMVS